MNNKSIIFILIGSVLMVLGNASFVSIVFLGHHPENIFGLGIFSFILMVSGAMIALGMLVRKIKSDFISLSFFNPSTE